MDIPEMVRNLALEAKAAARQVGNLSRAVKDRVILRVAELLEERRAAIQAENRRDLEAARWPRTTRRPSSTASPCRIRPSTP